MRVLHLVVRSHRRGAELAALDLATELEAMGDDNQVRALVLAFDGSRNPDLRPLVGRRQLHVPALILAARRLRTMLRRDPVDLILAHGGEAARVAGLAVPRGGPVLVWQRILDFPASIWRPSRRWWWRLVARRIDAAVALTEPLGDELRRLGFRGPVWVIPNSRQPARFAGVDRGVEGLALRDELGIDVDTPLVGFVGHLIRQKRPERALEVIAALHRRGWPAHLVVAGDGPLRAEVEHEVVRRGMGDHVSLLGDREDVERVLGGIDVLILTSEAEGIPGVVIEAQMSGCPVVSYPLVGVREVVEDGLTGVVAQRPDADVVAGHLADLLADDERRSTMGARARRVSGRFGVSRTAAVYRDRLSSLVTGE